MAIRSRVAYWFGRATMVAARLAGRGGTSLPGRVLSALDPSFLSRADWRPPRGIAVVSGTNGKTTTANMLGAILRRAGRRVLQNGAGANLRNGIVTAALSGLDWWGRPTREVAVFEVDEATIPKVAPDLRPRLLVLTNVFRDQLDRYGEVTYTARLLKRGLGSLAEGGWALVNADDPLLASLARGDRRIVYYGLEIEGAGGEGENSDIRSCPFCGAELRYRQRFFAHLGIYRCAACGWERPQPEYALVGYRSLGAEGSRLRLRNPDGEEEVRLPLPGLYNAYNALAAASAAHRLGVGLPLIRNALEDFQAAFGRMERVRVAGGEALVALVKNPTGFNQVLGIVQEDSQPKNLLLAINDRVADGTDVSWLWDVDFEALAASPWPRRIIVAGTRAADMAVRLKYAGFPEERIQIQGLAEALANGREELPPEGLLYVLPTYTALLEIRRHLAGRGYVRPFWQVSN